MFRREGGREGRNERRMMMLCSSEHCSKIQQSFPFHIRQEKKSSRILNNIPPRFIGFANHCMQPPLWQNKHVGQRENDFERKPPSFLQPTLSLLFLRSESFLAPLPTAKKTHRGEKKGFFSFSFSTFCCGKVVVASVATFPSYFPPKLLSVPNWRNG